MKFRELSKFHMPSGYRTQRVPNAGYIFIPTYGLGGYSANTNTLTEVIPQILAQGLMALRQMNSMPSLVNNDYSDEAAEKGSTIDVPIPSAITAQVVSPSNTPPDDAGVVPTSVNIALDQWYEAPFFLSDKDILEAQNGTIPMQASEAVKSLADQVNSNIFGKYTGVYGYEGTAAQTPFASDTSEATSVRRTLNNQLAPSNPRYMVIDPDAEANALNLRAFQDMNFGMTANDIATGNMAQRLGFAWSMDQQVPTHTAGTGTGILVNGTPSIGDTTVPIDTGSGTLVVGDIVTFAGHAQTYTVTTAVADVSSANMVISPALVAAPANNAAVTVKADHVVNLGFHRDAFAFASRPLEDSMAAQLGSIVQTMADPVSGIALRLEVTRQHKRVRWSYDILWGSATVRAALACRLAG